MAIDDYEHEAAVKGALTPFQLKRPLTPGLYTLLNTNGTPFGREARVMRPYHLEECDTYEKIVSLLHQEHTGWVWTYGVFLPARSQVIMLGKRVVISDLFYLHKALFGEVVGWICYDRRIKPFSIRPEILSR